MSYAGYSQESDQSSRYGQSDRRSSRRSQLAEGKEYGAASTASTDASQITDVAWGQLSLPQREAVVNALMYTYHPEDYFEGKKLGAGAFGVAKIIADRRSGKKFVLKELPKEKTKERELYNEVNILKHLQDICHGHLLCLEGFQKAGPTSNDHKIVTDIVIGQPLDKYITETPDAERWRNVERVLMSLSMSMKLMHDANVAHRDIKPSNTMINPKSSNVTIIDFGLACLRDECPSAGIAGTDLYMPPEIPMDGPHTVPLNFESFTKADYWALGVTMIEYIMGNQRFDHYTDVLNYPPQDLIRHLPREFTSRYPQVVRIIANLVDPNPAVRGRAAP